MSRPVFKPGWEPVDENPVATQAFVRTHQRWQNGPRNGELFAELVLVDGLGTIRKVDIDPWTALDLARGALDFVREAGHPADPDVHPKAGGVRVIMRRMESLDEALRGGTWRPRSSPTTRCFAR